MKQQESRIDPKIRFLFTYQFIKLLTFIYYLLNTCDVYVQLTNYVTKILSRDFNL